MMTSVSDIMKNEFFTVDAYDGLCVAGRIMDEHHLDTLIVLNEGIITGVLSSRDMRNAHPNRIVADAMNKNIVTLACEMSLWEAKEIFDECNMKEILVMDHEKPVGIISEARLNGELGKHIDLLTDLNKRDYIIQYGMDLMKKGNDVSVIFIDIDNFSKIDKEYGHIFGDEILKEIGMILNNHKNDETRICRFGGDEFVVLSPYKPEKSKNIAKKIQNDISSHQNSGGVSITASVGIAAGRRNYDIHSNLVQAILKLINLASLASTKAKNKVDKLVVVNNILEI